MARGPRWKLSNNEEAHPQRLDPFDLVIVGVTFVQRVATASNEVVGGVNGLLRGHANWRADRRDFDSAIRDDIERLP